MASAGGKRTAVGDDEAGAGGRARKAARKIGDEDDAPPAKAPAGRKPRQLRVKLTGESTCTRQLQVPRPLEKMRRSAAFFFAHPIAPHARRSHRRLSRELQDSPSGTSPDPIGTSSVTAAPQAAPASAASDAVALADLAGAPASKFDVGDTVILYNIALVSWPTSCLEMRRAPLASWPTRAAS